MEHSGDKLLYEGTSLELFLRLKYQLEANGIKYVDSRKTQDSWPRFFSQLFLFGSSRGMNDERDMHYKIYVAAEDYNRAFPLLKN